MNQSILSVEGGKNLSFITHCYEIAQEERKAFEAIKDQFGENHKRTLEANSKRLKGCTLEGSSRTGKTWDFCLFVADYVSKNTGKQITISRDTLATLKETTYDTLRKVWYHIGFDTSVFNKSATPIEINGNRISFMGINDNPMRAHGHESDILFFNEMMSLPEFVVNQMIQRNKEFFVGDMNPSAVDHWVFDWDNRKDVERIHSNIFENKHAPENAKAKILSYAHPDSNDYDVVKELGYSPEEWKQFKANNLLNGSASRFDWEVYGLGLRSVADDVVFPEFSLYVDQEEPASYDWLILGGDFGYSQDPSTVVQVIKNGHKVFLQQIMYEHGFTNPQISDYLKSKEKHKIRSVWDNSEPKSIQELRMLNVDAVGVSPKPRIYPSLEAFKKFKIFLHAESSEMINEFRRLKYLKDPKTNELKRNTFGEPVIKVETVPKDHTIDAARYALSYYLDVS